MNRFKENVMTASLSTIKNAAELHIKIMQLKSLREQQELELKKGVLELYQSIHPLNLLKSTMSEFASDKQVKFDATKIGLNLGSDFIIGKLLGSNMSIQKYLGSLVLQKASDYLINNHPEKITWGINKISALLNSFSKNKKEESEITEE